MAMRAQDDDEGGGKGPRGVIDVSWALGKFFFSLFHVMFFLLTNVLGLNYHYLQQQRQRKAGSDWDRDGGETRRRRPHRRRCREPLDRRGRGDGHDNGNEMAPR